MEAAESNAQQLKGPDSDSASIHRLATRRRPPVSGSQEKKSCYRCGRKNHHHSVCPFKDAKCHFCGKLGHLATVCRAKKRAEQEKKKDSKHVRKENWLWVEEADVSPVSEEETLPVFQIGSGKSTHPISVTVDFWHYHWTARTSVILSANQRMKTVETTCRSIASNRRQPSNSVAEYASVPQSPISQDSVSI